MSLRDALVKKQNKLTNLKGVPSGGIEYQESDLGAWLSAIAKGYNDILANAKVPEDVWVQGKDFPVKDHTAVISGAIDGAAAELTDKAQLVGLGLTVISDPLETADQLAGFVTDLDWEKTKDLVGTLAGGIVGYNHQEFTKGGEYARHATGNVGGTLAIDIATGGLVLGVLDAPKKLKNKLDDIVGILNRLRTKLKTRGWSDADIDTFLKDIEGSEDLLSKFDADELDPQAWKVMKDEGIGIAKRTAPEILETMSRHFKDTDFLTNLGGSVEGGKIKYAQIVKEYAGKCSTCGNQGYKNLPDTPDLYLNSMFDYTKKFGGYNIEGFEIPAFNGQPFSQDGFYHMMNHMNANVDAAKVKKVDMTFEDELGNSLPCIGQSQNCFDVQMKDGEIPKFYEYKSVESVRPKLTQFTAYLQNINSLSELKYIFNAKKLNSQQAKDGMKAFLKAKETQIIGIMNASVKTELGLASDATELTSSQIQKVVDIIVETK